jgi:glycine cleavage system H protein
MVDIGKYKIPDGLLYMKSHQWAKINGDVATIGITDYAQAELGNIAMVSLMVDVGKSVSQVQFKGNEPSSAPIPDVSIESSKTVAEIHSPVSGSITDVNKSLEDAPEKISKDPYGQGWIMKIKASNLAAEKGNLMDAAGYKKFLGSL